MSGTPDSASSASSASSGEPLPVRAADADAVRGRGAGRPGRPAQRAEAAGRTAGRHRIGIRELRQQASVYVDLAEKGYTVDITNRGRLVAQLIPVREPGSPLERLIAAGIVEPAEEPGGGGDRGSGGWGRGSSSRPRSRGAWATFRLTRLRDHGELPQDAGGQPGM